MAGGFSLDRTQSQGDLTGKQFLYDAPVTHTEIIAPGDVVTINGTASADGTPQVDTTVNTGATLLTGIVSGVQPIFSGEALSETALPALTAGKLLVNVDASALYQVDVLNGPLVVTDVGLNFNFSNTAASKTGGLSISNMELDRTGDGGGVISALKPFRLVAILPVTKEEPIFGNRALVRVNASSVLPGAIGVS